MTLFRKILILSHRYLGIALSLLVFVWFGSGIVMMYAGGMPRLTPQLRLERLPGLDLSSVRLTPGEAATRAVVSDAPGRATLSTVMGRPAYRFASATVFADTGEALVPLGVSEARMVASRFMNRPEDEIRFDRTLTQIDQWTLGQSRAMPLHKFRVDDDDATELYVSSRTGEIAMLTTRGTRTLAWIGVIPHWLYFSALRVNQPLRMIALCVGGMTSSGLGLFLGIRRMRRAAARATHRWAATPAAPDHSGTVPSGSRV